MIPEVLALWNRRGSCGAVTYSEGVVVRDSWPRANREQRNRPVASLAARRRGRGRILHSLFVEHTCMGFPYPTVVWRAVCAASS